MQVINEVHAFSFLCKPLEYDKLELQILELLNQLPDAIVEKNFYKVTDSNGKEYLSIKLKLRDILYFEYIKRSRKVLIALSDITYPHHPEANTAKADTNSPCFHAYKKHCGRRHVPRAC